MAGVGVLAQQPSLWASSHADTASQAWHSAISSPALSFLLQPLAGEHHRYQHQDISCCHRWAKWPLWAGRWEAMPALTLEAHPAAFT